MGWGVATTDSGIVFSQNAPDDVLVKGAGQVHAGLGGCGSFCIVNGILFGPVVVHIMVVGPIDPFEFAFEASGA